MNDTDDLLERLKEHLDYMAVEKDDFYTVGMLYDAMDEIKRLRSLNEKAAKTLEIAAAALGTLAIGGNHIASNAMLRMGEIADD